jgi:hypothetical protein
MILLLSRKVGAAHFSTTSSDFLPCAFDSNTGFVNMQELSEHRNFFLVNHPQYSAARKFFGGNF